MIRAGAWTVALWFAACTVAASVTISNTTDTATTTTDESHSPDPLNKNDSTAQTTALPTIPALKTNRTIVYRKPTQTPGGSMASKQHGGRTDSPMLNYIFDSHNAMNKHHHHDTYRYGPHFEDVESVGNATNMTVQVGSTANLNCRISLLQDKTVSWVRRKFDEDDLQLLTVGMHTYSGDTRYTVEFQYPNNWRLQIKAASKRDEGQYECQISTHPPRVIQINLHINAPEVMIVDEHGVPLLDKYYETDSTIQLACIVRHVAMTSSVVSWLHGDRMLNYDTTRGGISVRTELMEEGANSSLCVARVNKEDSGNYTCSISPTQYASVAVHVLNESLAELHYGTGYDVRPPLRLLPLFTAVLTVALLSR